MPHSSDSSSSSVLSRRQSENSRLKKIRQEKCVLYASMAAIALSVAGMSGTGVLYFKGISPRANSLRPSTKTEPIACVACSKFVRISSEDTNPDPLISKLTTLEEDDVQLCCAYNSDQMSALLELTMRRPELVQEPLPEFDPKHFTLSSVSAHKRLYLPAVKNQTCPVIDANSLVTTFFKAENDPLVEHFRGVRVQEKGLEIIQSGQYMIYSNIHFRPDSSYPCKNFTVQVWEHYVNKFSPQDPSSAGHILKTSHTCCDTCTRDDETSFTSGVFYLATGDVISVSVSGHCLVYFGKQSSFAGLMMLDGDRPLQEKA